MMHTMQLAIIKKDLRGITGNKRLFPVLIIVPLVLAIVMPLIFILTIHFAPQELDEFENVLKLLPMEQGDSVAQTITLFLLNNILPIFFAIIPIMAASVMAASSFVGEKEKRTLETLLYCPLSLRQIFQAKVLASFALSMLVSLLSFFAMLVVLESVLLFVTGSMLPLSITWLVMLLVVAPAVSLLAITIIVGGSAKAKTMEESQQRSVFLLLPLLLLIVGQFTGVMLVSAWFLLALGVVLGLIAALFMRNSMGKFTYETLLK